MTEKTDDKKTPLQIQNDKMKEDNLSFHQDYSSQEDDDFKTAILEAKSWPVKYNLGKVYDKDGVTELPGVRLYVEGAYKEKT